MKKFVAIVAAGMFAVSFAAQAEGGSGGCYGNSRTVSTPIPATGLETVSTPVTTPAVAVLDAVIRPVEAPKTDG